MSSTDPVIILEANFYQSLLSNRKILIENIIFSEEMITMCLEKKVVSVDNFSKFKNSDINAERIDYIIQSPQVKQSKYFLYFCEILTGCGQPLLAQILQESAVHNTEINIDDLLNSMPILKKSLRQKDKEQLQEYITEKVKSESVRSIVTYSKENQRKESFARVIQIQQSWKFQKDIKGKEKESNDLKEQLMSIEDQLVQKQDQLKTIKNELRESQQKQQNELQLAASFNSVNDRELQRFQTFVVAYKKMMEDIIFKVRTVIPTGDKATEKLLHEASENQMKKYDVEKQVDIFVELIEKMIEAFNILAAENLKFEKLKLEVLNVEKTLFPQRTPIPTDTLTSFIEDYQKMVTSTIKTLQNKSDMQENFIYGKIPLQLIPVQFQNIKIPSYERDEYTEIIKELQKKINMLESMLTTKEQDFERFVNHKVNGEKEIFLETSTSNSDEKANSDDIILQNQTQGNDSRRGTIPYSYPSKHKSRQPRTIDNKSKRTNVLKFSSVNFS